MRSLADLLTDPGALLPQDAAQVVSLGLGGAVRMRLPAVHPLRPLLRGAHQQLGQRHTIIRAEVRALLRAWSAEGIHPLLFKGFALAEFDYETPGERFYGDVDLLLPGDLPTVMRAAHIALAHGWRSDGQHADPSTWTHETMHLVSPAGQAQLDVHRYAVAAGGPLRQARLTAAVWQAARRVDWDGLPVWLAAPRDALVIQLALARQWGGDQGGVKPADYLDAEVLLCRHGLEPADLLARACEVGGQQTWQAFQAVCWPPERRLILEAGAASSVLRAGVQADGLAWERSHVWGRLLPGLPGRIPWLLRTLPDVAAAWWAVRRGGDPRRALARWTAQAAPLRRPSRQQMAGAISAVNWWNRLLYPRQMRRGVCVPRAYASYRALRRLGYPATFLSGVGRVNGALYSHAWVEGPRGPLEMYGEPLNRVRFRELLRYPADGPALGRGPT